MMKQMRFSILAVLLLLGLFKNASAQSCINDIQRLVVLENDVPDFSVLRTYIVCPGSLLNIGKLDTNFNLVGSNQPAVPLRPNMHLKCGDNGKRENYCAFINGDVHLDATKVLGVVDNERVDNILIEGFVFINSHKYSLWATKPGSIIFRDCEWREHTASLVPILLDFFDGTNAQLSVTFENCLFKNNRYFGLGSNTALVYANSAQNSLAFRQTVFEYNNMVFNNTMATSNSFIIETLGPLILEQSCFRNNVVGVSNAVVFGNTLTSSEINLFNSSGSICGFASVFQTSKQFDDNTPSCQTTSTGACSALATPGSTASPTPALTPGPTISPTPSPTPSPSAFLSDSSPTTNTLLPTVSPTAAPTEPGATMAPTEKVALTNAPVKFEFPDPTAAPVNVDGNQGDGSVGRSFCVVVISILCSSIMPWI